MTNTLTPTELANTVSSFALIWSGLTALAFCRWIAAQPRRWVAVYAGVLLTGLPTVWYHGFGETFVQGWADSSSNLLLAWLLVMAALGDGYGRKTRRWVGGVSGALNLAVIAFRALGGAAARHLTVIPLGEFGGFYLTEVALIATALLGVGLLYGRFERVALPARPLLYATTGVFLLGLGLATASNHQLDAQIVAYHALWHLAGSFGFLFLWAFNHVRLTCEQQQGVSRMDVEMSG